MVLQTPGNDFTGASAVAIYEDRHGKVFERTFLMGIPCFRYRVLALGADDPPVIDEHVAHLDGRRQQAARVEPQVQHQSLDALFDQLVQRPSQFLGRMASKCRETNVTDLLLFVVHPVPRIVGVTIVAQHGLDADDFTLQLDRLGSGRVRMDDFDGDFGADFSFHASNGFVDRNSLCRLAGDLDDVIARHHAGPIRRRSHQRTDDLQMAVLDGNLDTHTAELGLDACFEAIQLFGRDVVGIRVQFG